MDIANNLTFKGLVPLFRVADPGGDDPDPDPTFKENRTRIRPSKNKLDPI